MGWRISVASRSRATIKGGRTSFPLYASASIRSNLLGGAGLQGRVMKLETDRRDHTGTQLLWQEEHNKPWRLKQKQNN